MHASLLSTLLLIAHTLAPALAAAPSTQPTRTAGRLLGAPSPRARLEAIAQLERDRPSPEALQAPAPEGYNEALGPLPALTHPDATLDLDTIIERNAAAIDPPAPPPPPSPTESDLFQATRLYVAGQSKLLAGDARAAATDLEHATALDPGAPSLWLALGEARLQSAQEEAAIDAMRRAVALGLEHPRPLLLLCTWEATRAQLEPALHHGSRAVRALAPRQDPALAHMAWAALADALHNAALVHAAASAYTRAYDLPEQFPTGTRHPGDLSSMYRSASDALARAATSAIAVQDWPLAARALDLAVRFPSQDPGRLLVPRVHAAMRQGRPADASLAILHAIDQRSAATDPRTLRVIRHVRDHSTVGTSLAAALTEADARHRGHSATLDAALARAIAAALPDGLDRGPLMDLLARHPSDLGACRDLLASFTPDERAAAIDAAVLLASRHPAQAQTVGDAMILEGLRHPSDLDLLRARLDRPGAALLLARLLIESARFDDARNVLQQSQHTRPTAESADPPGDLRAARDLCLATLESVAARPAEARRVTDSWPTPTTLAQRLCLVRALVAIADPRSARDAADVPAVITAARPRTPGDSSPPAPAEDDAARALLLQSAQLARAAADPDAAQRLALNLLEADPYAEGAFAVLIALHAPTGPRPDQPRLQEAVQTLRERLPASLLLRFLSGRELLQFNRPAEADARLRALALDAPEDDNLFRALQEVWAQRAAREGSFIDDQARALLDRLISAHPALLVPHVARAQLAIARDKPEDVVPALSHWLDQRLITTADDRNRLRAVVEPLMRRATSTPDPRPRAALLALWDAMAAASVPLDPPMHQARLILLSQSPPIDDEALLAAAALACEQVPALGIGAFIAPVGRVVQAGRPDLGLVLLRAAAQRGPGLTADDTIRWAGLIAQHGSTDDLRDLLRHTTNPATLTAMLANLPGGPDQPPADPTRLRADIAYALSAATRILDRPWDASEAFLLMALEEFPKHESAANDLGYLWADRGVNLDHAERLLLMAIHLQPDEANVIDSLGWLRYKQGRLRDLLDPSGQVLPDGHGAVTLLERAVALLPDTSGPVSLDQLADALWRVDRHADAIARWQQALERAQRDLERLESREAPASMLAESRARLDALRAKIDAAEAGQQPPIAPLGQGITDIH